MSEGNKEPDQFALPLTQYMGEHEARLEKVTAPRKLERGLETVRWDGYTLVLFVVHSYLHPQQGHSSVLRLLLEAKRLYQSRLHVVYVSFAEQEIAKPSCLSFVPSFWLYNLGEYSGDFEWRSQRGARTKFWEWLEGSLGPAELCKETWLAYQIRGTRIRT
jgi:hypothetical protein